MYLIISFPLYQKFIAALPSPPSSLAILLNPPDSASSAIVNPIRREPILDHMRDLVQKCVDKGLLEFAFVHNLIWEYCQQCNGVQSRLNDLVSLLSDSARKLVSTKPGSRAMCVVISNSSAKDRKKIMKGLKGHVLECLLHDAAHLPVLRLIDVTDDTVNVQKLLLDEISSTKKTIQYAADGKVTGETIPLLAVAQSAVGSKLLLRLLNSSKSHLEPDEESLFDAATIAPGTSKKTSASRCKEHVAYLRNPLLTLCKKYTAVLLRCPNGSKVLLEVASMLFPVSVLTSVVDVFTGQERETADDEAEGDAAMEQENDEGSDESDDGEDESGDDDAEEDGNESDDGEDEDNQEPSSDNDIDDDEEEEEEQEQEKSSVIVPEVVLPIEEDPIAQSTLKKLLLLQLQRESADGADAEKSAAWEGYTASDGTSREYFPFASTLADALSSLPTEQFVSYVHRNRPCFILADLLKVPSVGNKQSLLVHALGSAEAQQALKESAKKIPGGKFLQSAFKLITDSAKSKKKK